jgi:protein-S-isoprenylcysteine O-methyltransferase Ste14
MMRITILVLAITNFALFAVALRLLFARERRTPLRTRVMVDVGVVISCLHVYGLATAPLKTSAVEIAAALYVVAAALFTWAALSVRGRGFKLAYVPNSPNAVFTGGPYRWFRHPLYLSYALAWIAGAVAAMSVPLLFTAAAMIAFYVGAAYREERQMLRSAAGDDYRAYRRQAGVLLPKSLLLGDRSVGSV